MCPTVSRGIGQICTMPILGLYSYNSCNVFHFTDCSKVVNIQMENERTEVWITQKYE